MENLKVNRLSIEELMSQLKKWDDRKQDLIVPAKQLFMADGMLQHQTRPEILDPTRPMTNQIASKLGIPQRYYDKMAEENTGLLDTNVTSWLSRSESNHLIRSYSPEETGGISIGRALLSDKYKIIDHTSILMAVLTTIMKNGLNIAVESADITENKMYVRFVAPDVIYHPETFLKNYKAPSKHTHEIHGFDHGGITAGFVLSNSETGQGAYSILPRAIVAMCMNGLIQYSAVKRKLHLGSKLEEGDIDWSAGTKEKNMALIQSQMQDYILNFTTKEYLKSHIDELEGKAAEPLLYPVEATQNVCGLLSLDQEQTAEVMRYFMESGDTTRGGTIQALTYFAHEQDNGDLRYDLERNVEFVLDNIPQLDRLETVEVEK